MDDEDTLDEPEELLERARNAAAKNQVPDEQPAGVDDETIPAEQDPSAVAGLDDETIPAKQDASAVAGLDDETIPAKQDPSAVAGLDDETIDVDPELIRRLREQRAEQQPTDPDPTIARGSHETLSALDEAARMRVIAHIGETAEPGPEPAGPVGLSGPESGWCGARRGFGRTRR